MSTENPLLQFSPNAPWGMVDMAAAAAMVFPKASPLEEELMDLDSLGFTDSSPLHQAAAAIFRPDNSPQSLKSWGATFSFDSTILEELLADNSDVTSMNNNLQAPERGEDDQLVGRRNSVTECLADALRIISCSEPDALAQVWVPIVRGNKLFLTTQEQPYSVVPVKVELMLYRSLSTGYVFPSQKDSEAYPGLPGRVFSRLAPEWTPNVQYYDSKEYLRVRDAARCDVKGTLAVPVVDPSSHSCLGVIELVTNVEKVEYSSELKTICRALQAVNLSAATEGNQLRAPEVSTKGREAVLAEITEVLTRVCGAHKLPLAQTWLPCVHTGVGSEKTHFFSSTDPAGVISLFTNDAPYFLADTRLHGFHQACSEHTLEKGQGVAGKAFISNQPSSIADIRCFSKEEYPLVHYARFFKLGAAVAIRLRSLHTGADDYVLEFFLPLECRDSDKQQQLLSALSVSMQRACKTLRIVTEQEIAAQGQSDVIGQMEDDNVSQERLSGNAKPTSKKHSTSCEELDSGFHKSKKTRQGHEAADPVTPTAPLPCSVPDKKRAERRRNAGEKTIGLDVLQQYFAGSLKDAAKSIGVCPTTLKRICRQYGISRWPSRKINKVSRSLIKLQGVIDSVQGIDGAVRLNTLTGELASAAAAAAAITMGSSGCDAMKGGEASQQQTEAHMSKNSSCSENDRKINVECGRGLKRSQSCSYPQRMMSPLKVEEHRVHGSCAALAALQAGFELPCPPPEENDVAMGMRTWSSAEDLSRMEGGLSSSPYISSGDCASPTSPPEGHSELSAVTVKASFGADTIRFKMPALFEHRQLREEVTSRFRLEQDSFSLRYLDDDAEWVMLEGDADLEECLDIMKMARSHTIKLTIKDRLHGSTSCHSLSSVKL